MVAAPIRGRRVAHRESTVAAAGRGHRRGRVFDAQLQGRDDPRRGSAGWCATYPHVPGIDFAGTVERSDSPDFKPGDKVVLTGWRVGEVQWGGYAEKARVKAGYLVRCPPGSTPRQAMAIGTAGLHRDAGGHRARAARARARRGRGAGHRRRRRGRQRRGSAAVAARVPRRRLDRPAGISATI